MTILEIVSLLRGTVLCGTVDEKDNVEYCFASDLMSDVLTFTKRKTLLLTGLTNVQVVRTAELSDLCAIVFVRGKLPGKEIVEAAKANDIPLLVTCYTLFEDCGRLYEMGIKGCPHKVFTDE